jgi:pimeloyl-ACP methyl ester carboxylesterase
MRTQILLLHGALGSAQEFEALEQKLQNEFVVHSLNLPGHAGSGFLETPLALENTREYLDNFIASTFDPGLPLMVFGHSMGGYLALYSLLKGNTQIGSVITLGTKLHWSQDIASREIAMLDPHKMAEKVPHFAESLKTIHGADVWQKLTFEVSSFLKDLGEKNPLSPDKVRDLHQPCRIMLGDRDRMVGMEETLAFYQALPNASLGILPNTPHPFAQADTGRLYFEICEVASALRQSAQA